ncbi:MAG TPA: PKD domain-containing protein, partial [Flavisolibacter sp.]|nr:PKD domain-containing protein [Flavisolibacter sp.]
MRIALSLIVFVCTLNSALAQKETANWFLFANRVSVTPSGISNSAGYGNQVGAYFTSTSISDSAGNLLFACDGSKIMDKNLQVMPLLANDWYHLGAQKVLAVKIPASTKYYVFYSFKNSSIANAPSEFFYSIVDLSLNGGNGDIIVHEKLFATDVSAAFTLARSPGTDDAWLVTHRNATDTFLSYKVTAAGLSEVPVISKAGMNVTTSEYLFQDLKTSPNGQMIAGVVYKDYTNWFALTYQFIETFHFDGVTGKLSNRLRSTRLGSGYFQNYQSLEFSPDNRLLYLGNMQRIHGLQPCGYGAGTITQYNLCYADSVTFTRNATVVATNFAWCNPFASWGRLQIGADKRIYTVYSGNTVSAINNPNRIGTSANFQFNAHTLLNINGGNVGVPDFYHPLMEKAVKNNIVYEGGCFPAPTRFRVSNDTITSIQWNFGDPASAANTSTQLAPTHQFSGPGFYTVTATLFNSLQQQIETITELVEIRDPAKRVLHAYPKDTTICSGQTVKIKLAAVNGIFVWTRTNAYSTDAFYRTADSVDLESEGTYYVQMRQGDCNGCVMTDSIKIKVLPVPYVSLGYDRELCAGDSLTLSAEGPPASNLWSTGATTPSILVKTGGVYWVRSEYNNNGCPRTDTIVIKAVPGVNFALPPDTTLCNNQTLLLNPGVTGAWYTWQDGSSASSFEVSGPGKYWVRIMNNNY